MKRQLLVALLLLGRGACYRDEVVVWPGSCGDGRIAAGEECDGDDLGGATCKSLGFARGQLACASDCTLDTSGCVPVSPEICDNGVDDDGDGSTDCVDPDCSSSPQCGPACGNGIMEPGEQCDGTDFGDASCRDFGFTSGTLTCTQACTIDHTTCQAVCGNTVVEPGEDCDDGNRQSGDGCSSTCTFEEICDNGVDDDGDGSTDCDDADCADHPACSSCGDGRAEPPEECDGRDMAGATCESLGFRGGTLLCNRDCTYDTSQCQS